MLKIDPKYPSIEDLENRARKKMPRFAFDYLSGGANEEINLRKNTEDIRKVELSPEYLTKHNKSSMEVTLFNHTYSSPFGIAPIGLQGLMWPNSPEILALAAHSHNIPFILSNCYHQQHRENQ